MQHSDTQSVPHVCKKRLALLGRRNALSSVPGTPPPLSGFRTPLSKVCVLYEEGVKWSPFQSSGGPWLTDIPCLLDQQPEVRNIHEPPPELHRICSRRHWKYYSLPLGSSKCNYLEVSYLPGPFITLNPAMPESNMLLKFLSIEAKSTYFIPIFN